MADLAAQMAALRAENEMLIQKLNKSRGASKGCAGCRARAPYDGGRPHRHFDAVFDVLSLSLLSPHLSSLPSQAPRPLRLVLPRQCR
jgi:hypothetical protein